MSEKELDRAIIAAVTETFENMVFMEALPFSEAHVDTGREDLTAGLLIHDPWPADLRLTFPRTLLGKVAEAVYALPAENLEDQTLRDLLAELLNTLAGRFLTTFLPPEQSYRLGLPEFGDESALPAEAGAKLWHFRMEDEFFILHLRGEALLHS